MGLNEGTEISGKYLASFLISSNWEMEGPFLEEGLLTIAGLKTNQTIKKNPYVWRQYISLFLKHNKRVGCFSAF